MDVVGSAYFGAPTAYVRHTSASRCLTRALLSPTLCGLSGAPNVKTAARRLMRVRRAPGRFQIVRTFRARVMESLR